MPSNYEYPVWRQREDDLNAAIRMFDVACLCVNQTSQPQAVAAMSTADLAMTPNGWNAF